MKRCCKCRFEKPFEEFSKNKSRKDGYQDECKSCVKKYKKQYYEENKDKISEYRKQYREENKDKVLEKEKQYREENKDKISEYHKQYYEENKDKISEQHKQYGKKYREENKDKISEKNKQYYKENKEVYLANNAKRRAAKLQATPPWLTEEQLEEMQDFYTICKIFQIYTGLTYHVDHIMPLQGETVCGLHVPWNLQILEASTNLSKSNRLLEEYLYE